MASLSLISHFLGIRASYKIGSVLWRETRSWCNDQWMLLQNDFCCIPLPRSVSSLAGRVLGRTDPFVQLCRTRLIKGTGCLKRL